MKKILFIGRAGVVAGLISLLPAVWASAAPQYVVETLTASNELAPSVVCSTGSFSAVAVSSTTVTRVDSAFNTAAALACGAGYQRAEIITQNNSAGNIFCSFSPGTTVSNSPELYGLGGERFWKVGKGMPIYCLAAAASITTVPASILIVGGVAWR